MKMCKRLLILLCLVFVIFGSASAQLVGFRVAANSGMLISELGESDVLNDYTLLLTPAINSEKFSAQPTVGFEGEVLFQASPKSQLGLELEYIKMKGENDTPPYYNYYQTSYYKDFQRDFDEVVPIKFNTSLINVAANWRYFFFQDSKLNPFLKLTGVVSFIATESLIKNDEDAMDLESNVLYARGTSNSEKGRWPAFHFGGGVGFDYKINENFSFQMDGIMTVVNSDILDGIPNFSYVVEEDGSYFRHNKRPSLTLQFSAGLVYSFEMEGQGGTHGKTSGNLPFYRKK